MYTKKILFRILLWRVRGQCVSYECKPKKFGRNIRKKYMKESINKHDGWYFHVTEKVINLEFNLGINKTRFL